MALDTRTGCVYTGAMNTNLIFPLMSMIVLMSLTACQHAKPLPEAAPAEPDAARELRPLLEKAPDAPLIPELAAANTAAIADSPTGRALLEWARGAAKTATIPETTYTDYRRFRVAGDRPPYERPYFDKRMLLAAESVRAWLIPDEARIDRINDLIWSICEETTWVVPAHEKEPWTIDLFASETGAELAHVLLLIGDKLPEEVRERVQNEVKVRILDRFLEYGPQYSWGAGHNNWTGVCAGSIGQTFLLMEPDLDRQAKALSLVLTYLDNFIKNAFEEDGGCLEGIGYWNYGLIHYVGFAEMLRQRTQGAIDLLAQDKIKAIARYPLDVYLGNGLYASFADAHEHSSVRPFLAARFAERTGATGLLGLVDGVEEWRLSSVLRNVLWWDGKKVEEPTLDDVLMPVSGIARLVGETHGLPLALVIKAGHNAEPHNHNDVGSFVLCIDGTVYLCDPGAGLYNKDYFSSKRYENALANSYGHSVPRIGGELQSTGKQRRGTIEACGEKGLRIRFEGAYDIATLREAERRVALRDGVIRFDEVFAFDGAGEDVEEAFVTWLPVEVDGAVARVSSDKGTLEIRADQGTFTAERLVDACKANHKKEVLTRIAVTYPAGAHMAAGFTITFVPQG